MSSHCVSTFILKRFRRVLNEMRRRNEGTDLVIICDGRKFQVHKIILSAGSSFFRNKFQGDFKESILEMNEIAPDIMKLILDFLYLDFSEIDNYDFTSLLIAASDLDIPELCECCWQKLLGNVSVKSYLELWNMALIYNKSDVIEKVLDFIVSHLYEAMEEQTFNEMNFLQMEKLVKKIESLEIPMEIFIMERIFNWARHNEEERLPHLRTLVTHLSITTLPSKYLEQLMKTEPLIVNDGKLRYTMNEKLKKKIHSDKSRENGVMGSHHLLRFTNTRYQYIDYPSCQKNECHLPFPLTKGMSCSQSGEYIYFVGGASSDGSSYSNTFIQFCLKTNTAEYLSRIPKPVSFAHTCVINSIFYVVAGIEKNQNYLVKTKQKIQYYKPDIKKWSSITFPELDVKLCANLDNSLFILCEKEENIFQWYKVNESMKCVFEGEMPYSFSLDANLSGAYNDSLYSLVTFQNQNLVCIYCATEKTWKTIYFNGEMPDFVYFVLTIDEEFCIICLSREKICVLKSKENRIEPLMINSTFSVQFEDVLPFDHDENFACINLAYWNHPDL